MIYANLISITTAVLNICHWIQFFSMFMYINVKCCSLFWRNLLSLVRDDEDQ